MSIDRQTIKWVALLARLRLGAEEEGSMRTQLGKILDYMDILGELNLEDVKPTAHTLGFINKTRSDEEVESFKVECVAGMAPEWKNDHVVVPRIV